MTDQKAENLLNLALSVPEAERKQTAELNVGFEQKDRTWEIIVKYNGDLRAVLETRFPKVRVHILTGGFAILRVPQEQIEQVISLKEIEYAEKPKRLYFAVDRARSASCLIPVQTGAEGLSGRGVLLGIVDSGIDYFHEDFRNADGSSRILFLADQVSGNIYTKTEIDRALRSGNREEAKKWIPSEDVGGHGTAVAGIAAGNGRESGGKYRGVAYESELAIVRLGIAGPNDFPRTTQLMEGVELIVRAASELSIPLALNISFGNSYGSHDGNGLLERYLDSLSGVGKSVFVIGTGNEGASGGHASGRLQSGEAAEIELSIAPYEMGFGLQIWKNYEDDLQIWISDPAMTEVREVSRRLGTQRILLKNAMILGYYGEPGPYNTAQEVYLEFLPVKQYIESGIWRIILKAGRVREGSYDLWLPAESALNKSTRFLRPTPDTTLTIPSTAIRPISVGAYDASTGTYAPFSGRGDTRLRRLPKPDLAAPGVGIMTTKSGGGYSPVTGTSFAAPMVTGAAALLMEWGIVRGNDPYLYSDKVKAYLRKGAKALPGFEAYPNPEVGWGALCVSESLPSKI